MPPHHILTLGSSFASGPSIPPPIPPLAAKRSGRNYAHLLSASLRCKLTDRSASGATLLNVLDTPQEVLGATLPAQLDLDGVEGVGDVDVVTLTAGGNDMGYSGAMIADAARRTIEDEDLLDVLLQTLGLPPASAAPVAANEVTEKELTDRFARVLDAIRKRFPGAKVFMVEYLPVFHASVTRLAPDQPLPLDALGPHLARAEELARAYRAAAAQVGGDVEVVRLSEVGEAHALGSGEPWVVGFTKEMLMSGGAPYHPSGAGHAGVAKALEERIKG